MFCQLWDESTIVDMAKMGLWCKRLLLKTETQHCHEAQKERHPIVGVIFVFVSFTQLMKRFFCETDGITFEKEKNRLAIAYVNNT